MGPRGARRSRARAVDVRLFDRHGYRWAQAPVVPREAESTSGACWASHALGCQPSLRSGGGECLLLVHVPVAVLLLMSARSKGCYAAQTRRFNREPAHLMEVLHSRYVCCLCETQGHRQPPREAAPRPPACLRPDTTAPYLPLCGSSPTRTAPC
jgi:hypothetical protein